MSNLLINIPMKNLNSKMIVIVWFTAITFIALYLSSCSTAYSVSERKIAPIVNHYDVKQIKSQTASNVRP